MCRSFGFKPDAKTWKIAKLLQVSDTEMRCFFFWKTGDLKSTIHRKISSIYCSNVPIGVTNCFELVHDPSIKNNNKQFYEKAIRFIVSNSDKWPSSEYEQKIKSLTKDMLVDFSVVILKILDQNKKWSTSTKQFRGFVCNRIVHTNFWKRFFFQMSLGKWSSSFQLFGRGYSNQGSSDFPFRHC